MEMSFDESANSPDRSMQHTANSGFQDLSYIFDDKLNNKPNEMFSWMICQLTEDNKPFNMLYGQFSASFYPPKTGWVFLANNEEYNPNALPVSVFQQVKVVPKQFNDDTQKATSPGNPNNNKSQGDLSPASAPSRYYKVSGCPIPNVNGRYLNNGLYKQPVPPNAYGGGAEVMESSFASTTGNKNEAIKYRNVRDFYIIRFDLCFVVVAERFY